MKKNILIAILCLFVFAFAKAQSVKITGVVADSLGNTLGMANVIAYQQDKNLGAFGITNDQGKYQLLNLKKDSTYILKVSFLGLKTIEDTVKNIQTDLVKNYIMLNGADELDAINIVYEMPVSIKGDTIVYNADSFTNGTEDKLEDTLNKLPGVEVNEDGDILVEGKQVEKVMVEGKDFFEGDSRLATKNIPADAIDKVQVLRNYNNRSQLKGLGNDQDRVVINLKLKEGKKKFWFGEATVGAGYGGDKARYIIQPKAFYYSEDFSMNILTDFNDLGTPAFTGRDYFRFIGFSRRDTRQNNSSINVQAQNPLNVFQGNRALNIESQFGALNTSWSVNNKLDISSFAIVSKNTIDTRSTSRRTFVDNSNTEETDNRGVDETVAALFKLGAEYNPTDAFTLSYDGRFNYADQQGVSDLSSIDREADRSIDTRDEQQPITFNQSLNMYYTANEKNIFAFESQFLNQYEDPFYNAVLDIDPFDPTTNTEPFNGRLGIGEQDIYNINQEQFVNTNKLDAKLDYYYVLNKKSNLNFTAGTSYVSQNFDSDIFEIQADGTRNELQDSDLRNDDVNFDFLDVYGAVHYKAILGKFTITPGLTAHSFQTKDRQNGVTNTIETERVVPDVEVRYDFRSSETLTLNYDQNVTFNDVNSYANGILFRGYSSLQSGNNQIEGALNDRVRLSYRNFNMFNYTTIFGNVTYTRLTDAIQNEVALDGINQVSRPINALLPNESLSATGSFGREIKKIQATVTANVSWSENNNIINNITQTATNFNQNYSFRARSNFQKGINFSLQYALNLNNSENGNFENDATTNSINLDLDYQLGKSWLFKAGYDYNIFTATGDVENNFEFFDASIRYQKPDSRWRYELIATNLLDTEANIRNSFGQIATSTNATFVLPRYVYFRMRFDI
ncbi:hypothetical protein BST91_10695 [Nonlabens tegetincola]|uniref:carboxypeptidase regulatory-like domain-containing protein n=1 Tax=Nonlabens tegetincola TaxID=323273 RepID=UPI000A202599|nr:carboxypeptidase regulatory-like domain-containing protein [Nonlabens tegetincola]ARN72085.1 hypothetical protein BST91_10695 [Nonlabens tegetincola]